MATRDYVIRARKGKPIKVDKQIILWRATGGPQALRKAVLEGKGLPTEETPAKARGRVYNPFNGE